jgi:hypothetical protein
LIRHERVETPSKGVFVDAQLTGSTRLSIIAVKACDLNNAQRVNRTTTVENYNADPGKTWFYAGLGVISIGAGTGLIVDSSSTYPNDKTSRTYNETGPDKERNWGYALIGTGAVLTAIAVVDAIRASGSETKESDATLPGTTLQRGLRCANQPAGGTGVMGIVEGQGGNAYELGVTDPTGRLEVDLDKALPQDVTLETTSRLEVIISGVRAGDVELGGLQHLRSARAFARLAPTTCSNPTTPRSCDEVRAFVDTYPDGTEAQKARSVLAIGEPLITALVDDQEWAPLDIGACTQQGFAFPEQILEACRPIEGYLAARPNGRHRAEAERALAQGRARAEKLEAKLDANRKAEERKEAAQAKSQCVGRCKVICSSWRFDDKSACFEGCVQNDCSEGQ